MDRDFLNKYSLIIVLCFIISVFGILHVIVGSARSPAGMVYLWTGHYYLDYFYYLTPIAQGARGYLVAFSQAATDDPTRFIHLWPYVLLGNIFGLLKLSPIAIYWLTVLILAFILVFLIFKTMEKLLDKEPLGVKSSALLLCIFATPFFQPVIQGKNFSLNLYDFWYSNSTFFRRFEPVPHHLLSSVLIMLAFLRVDNLIKNRQKTGLKQVLLESMLIGLLAAAVLSFNSFSMLVPFAALSATVFLCAGYFFLHKEYKSAIHLALFLVISTFLFGLTGLLLKNYYDSTLFASTFKNVEAALHQDISLKIVLLSHGPLIILALAGLITFLKNLKPLKVMMLIFLVLSYGLYFTDLDKILGTHNGRFLSPLSYVPLGALAVLAIRRLRFKYLLVILLLIYGIPVNLKVFMETIRDKNISSPISYLPTGVIEGFRFLDKQPDRGNVLMTPSQFLGVVMPVFADRKTYVARQIVTPDYLNKNVRASNFYLGAMTKEEALNFLVRNNLKFVILTSVEGYNPEQLYKYPFLKEIYKNKDIIIFKNAN